MKVFHLVIDDEDMARDMLQGLGYVSSHTDFRPTDERIELLMQDIEKEFEIERQ